MPAPKTRTAAPLQKQPVDIRWQSEYARQYSFAWPAHKTAKAAAKPTNNPLHTRFNNTNPAASSKTLSEDAQILSNELHALENRSRPLQYANMAPPKIDTYPSPLNIKFESDQNYGYAPVTPKTQKKKSMGGGFAGKLYSSSHSRRQDQQDFPTPPHQTTPFLQEQAEREQHEQQDYAPEFTVDSTGFVYRPHNRDTHPHPNNASPENTTATTLANLTAASRKHRNLPPPPSSTSTSHRSRPTSSTPSTTTDVLNTRNGFPTRPTAAPPSRSTTNNPHHQQYQPQDLHTSPPPPRHTQLPITPTSAYHNHPSHSTSPHHHHDQATTTLFQTTVPFKAAPHPGGYVNPFLRRPGGVTGEMVRRGGGHDVPMNGYDFSACQREQEGGRVYAVQQVQQRGDEKGGEGWELEEDGGDGDEVDSFRGEEEEGEVQFRPSRLIGKGRGKSAGVRVVQRGDEVKRNGSGGSSVSGLSVGEVEGRYEAQQDTRTMRNHPTIRPSSGASNGSASSSLSSGSTAVDSFTSSQIQNEMDTRYNHARFTDSPSQHEDAEQEEPDSDSHMYKHQPPPLATATAPAPKKNDPYVSEYNREFQDWSRKRQKDMEALFARKAGGKKGDPLVMLGVGAK
ncbi:hypothetical protein HDU98_005081 [Podochytrium sp. JEL0797]|nr:hypothetical protein HDU98_005081 [Podochytrium sp. JEL0797]